MDEDQQSQTPLPPDGWELMCSGVLSTEFGRRPSDAVTNAVRQLASEEAVPARWREQWRGWWQRLNPVPRYMFVTACVLALGVATWSVWTTTGGFRTASTVCTISEALDVHWASGSTRPDVGDALASGTLRLESGVVELTFNSKARVAIEGPAQIRLTGSNSMELASGKLSAEVPKPAHGFCVKTPKVTVVDLGTRFGLEVGADQAARVDVFEGKVRLTTNFNGTIPDKQWELPQNAGATVAADGTVTRSRAVAETAYPELSLLFVIHPANCGFDAEGRMALGMMPTNSGYWSGPAFEMAPATEDIKPVEGRGMLHFLPPPEGNVSEIWQVIDLHSHRTLLAKGDLEIRSFVWFNRERGGVNSVKKFGLTVAAYHGKLVDLDRLWANRKELALSVAEKEFDADNDPATWEKVEVSSALPANADFLIVSMHATAPDNAIPATAFSGNFADLIDCTLFTPLHASSTKR